MGLTGGKSELAPVVQGTGPDGVAALQVTAIEAFEVSTMRSFLCTWHGRITLQTQTREMPKYVSCPIA